MFKAKPELSKEINIATQINITLLKRVLVVLCVDLEDE